MSKKKLIEQLKEKNPKLNQSDLETAILTFSNSIISALKNEKTVEIRGLGRWYFKKLKENYNARNPLTNEILYKPERLKLRFKTSKRKNELSNNICTVIVY